MQGRAAGAADLAEVPEATRPILEALRDPSRRRLVGQDEGIAHGMSTDSRGGKPAVAFASRTGAGAADHPPARVAPFSWLGG